MAPVHPRRGQDHILDAPAIPAPIPITGPRPVRNSLLIVQKRLALTDEVRAWIKRFVETRLATATGRAMRNPAPMINLIVDAEDEIALALASRVQRTGPKVRGRRCPLKEGEAAIIRSEYNHARFEVDHFFKNFHEHQDKIVQGIDVLSTELRRTHEASRGNIGESLVLPVLEYVRASLPDYDEFIFLVSKELGPKTWISGWKRFSRAWIVRFDEAPPAVIAKPPTDSSAPA